MKERLIINHLIVFYNVFEVKAATRILFFKVEKEYHPVLKTFLVFLNKMPYDMDHKLTSDNIDLDEKLVEILRKIN